MPLQVVYPFPDYGEVKIASDEDIVQANSIFKKNSFHKATKYLEQCDNINLMSFSEFAFVGRSNVGKSSLVNKLLGSNLAQTSKTPGRTQ